LQQPERNRLSRGELGVPLFAASATAVCFGSVTTSLVAVSSRRQKTAYEMADAIAPDLILLGELPSGHEAVAFLDAIRSGADPFDAETAVVVLSRAGADVEVLRAVELQAKADIAAKEKRATRADKREAGFPERRTDDAQIAAVNAPSTATAAPCTKPAASLSRKATTRAISRGSA
jgi:hypothetical protein